MAMDSLLKRLRLSPVSEEPAYEAVRSRRIEEVRALLAEIAVRPPPGSRDDREIDTRKTHEPRETCCA
jgi:hypothetical protein